MKLLWGIPELVSSLIIFIIFVRFIINYIQHKSEHRIPFKTILFASISINIFFIVFSIYLSKNILKLYSGIFSFMTTMVLGAIIDFNNWYLTDNIYKILDASWGVCWYVGNSCIYIVMMRNLNNGFTDSILSFNKTTKVILSLLVSLSLCAALAFYVWYEMYVNVVNPANDKRQLTVILLLHLGVQWLLDLMISNIILYHFISKFRYGIEKTYFSGNNNIISSNSNNNDNNNNNNISCTHSSVQLIYSDSRSITLLSNNTSNKNNSNYVFQIITFGKLSLLYIIITITIQIDIILSIVHFILWHYSHSGLPYIISAYVWVFYNMIACIIKSFCISLCFIFGHKRYGKICGRLDVKIRQCCMERIRQKVTQNRSS